jgi:hypothetical protein
VNVFGNNFTKEAWKKEFREFEGDNFFVSFEYGPSWAMFSVVDGTLSSMRRFACFGYDYFINLSGQCYPLKSINSIKGLLQDKDFAYMENFKLPAPAYWANNGGLDRFEYSYYKNPFFILGDILLNKKTARTLGSLGHGPKMFIKLPKLHRQLPYKLEPYGGSAYFCLSKKHVDYVLEYLKNKPNLIAFFKHAFAPDEIFFQTVILNSVLKETVINDNLRYIDWSKKGVTPAILTIDDADNLLNSPKLFARKFDIESDKAILDLIDRSKG